MGLDKVLRFLISSLLAMMVCFWIYKVDRRAAHLQNLQQNLNWMRQVSKQTESLFLYAQTSRLARPLHWAADQLSRGMESRPMTVSVLPEWREPAEGGNERFEWDESSGQFIYVTKMGMSQRAIQIQAQFLPRFFAGSHSQIKGESILFALFLALTWVFYLLQDQWKLWKSRGKTSVPVKTVSHLLAENSARPESSDNVVPLFAEKVTENKPELVKEISYLPKVKELNDINSSLSHLAVKVRKVVVSTKDMVAAANRSKSGFSGMMTELDGAFRTIDGLKEVLNVLIEGAETAKDLAQKAKMDDLTHASEASLMQMDQLRMLVVEIENAVLPWGQRVRTVQELQNEILEKGKKMHTVILEATQSMSLHAEHLEELEKQARDSKRTMSA